MGFNPGAKLDGKILEAERVFGCLSVGIGRSPFHTDGVIKKPSIIVDHITIDRNGFFTDKKLSGLEQRMLYGNSQEDDSTG
jgi:leucyl aminopeptidase (aminopeptidase T)